MSSDQESAEAGRTPSFASVAEPEKLMVSSTFQVRVGAGEAIVATGGESPAVIRTDDVALDAPGSVTRSRTV